MVLIVAPIGYTLRRMARLSWPACWLHTCRYAWFSCQPIDEQWPIQILPGPGVE